MVLRGGPEERHPSGRANEGGVRPQVREEREKFVPHQP